MKVLFTSFLILPLVSNAFGFLDSLKAPQRLMQTLATLNVDNCKKVLAAVTFLQIESSEIPSLAALEEDSLKQLSIYVEEKDISSFKVAVDTIKKQDACSTLIKGQIVEAFNKKTHKVIVLAQPFFEELTTKLGPDGKFNGKKELTVALFDCPGKSTDKRIVFYADRSEVNTKWCWTLSNGMDCLSLGLTHIKTIKC